MILDFDPTRGLIIIPESDKDSIVLANLLAKIDKYHDKVVIPLESLAPKPSTKPSEN